MENRIFTTHHLDHPKLAETRVLGGWSYIGGALLGPVYVLASGFVGGALVMVIYTAAIATAAFLSISFIAVSASKPAPTLLGIVAILAVALAVQAKLAVRQVLIGYLKRGFREGYY